MAERESTMIVESAEQLMQPGSRRKFLKVMGMGGSVVLLPSLFAACSNNDDSNGTGITNPPSSAVTLNLSNDFGILNYAYALEQLEAAFYTTAIGSSAFNSLSAAEQEVIGDLQRHEVIHREFFKVALGTNAIGTIGFNSTTVGSLITNRATLLSTSQLLEDTGVSAYNGAGKYLQSATYLTLAGKIVSVEARHAAAIRDIRDTVGTKFAGDDVVDAAGLDVKAEPGTVLASVKGLNVLTTTINTTGSLNGTATADKPAPSPS